MPGSMASMRAGLFAALATLGCSANFPAPANFLADDDDDDGQTEDTAASSSTGVVDLGCAQDAETMADCVEVPRYVTDLEFIADVRTPGDPHWQSVQDLCFDRFTELGYEVELHMYGTGINVIGTRLGLTLPEELVVVAAHYDHIEDCGGADDNATGVAGVLEVARVLAEAQYERTTVVACWDQEEIGLFGSRSWVLRARDETPGIVANFNFEMIGFTDSAPNTQGVPAGFDLLFPEAVGELAERDNAGDFITLVADDLAVAPAAALQAHADRIGLPLLYLELPADLKNSPLLSDLRRSDHAPFWDYDYPAMMLTDTANFRNAAYHCVAGQDTVDRLDHEFSGQVVSATTGAVVETLGLLPPGP